MNFFSCFLILCGLCFKFAVHAISDYVLSTLCGRILFFSFVCKGHRKGFWCHHLDSFVKCQIPPPDGGDKREGDVSG